MVTVLVSRWIEIVTTYKADYMYQIPTIAGNQIRINRLSDTNRLFFKLENDLTGDITISTDGGTTEKPLVDVDENPITQLEKGFVEVVADASFFILRNRGISGADRQALIDIVNEAEANESDLKTQFVDTVNDKTGSALPVNATWLDVKNAIANMTNRKYKTGTKSFQGPANSIEWSTVQDLGFKPTLIVMSRDIGGVSTSNVLIYNEKTSSDKYTNFPSFGGQITNNNNIDGISSYIKEDSFRLAISSHGPGLSYDWIAIG